MKKIVATILFFTVLFVSAQEHNRSASYVWPPDSLVMEKLKDWQDIKFGLLMHWGTYSQWGIVESWSICPEDEGWTQRRGPYAKSYSSYVKAYENLQTSFAPSSFKPEKWAQAAADAGMKYVVFTTKHHDGFCMFDTKQTDYKITSPKTPFSASSRKNVTKEIFNAFRAKGFMTGAYFSKPDWHNENYWWPYFPPKDRNVNYDPRKYPEKWNAFKNFTYKQIEELMTGYGKVDILWLDGGWVRPFTTIDKSVDWQKSIPYDQDIDMPRIATMARTNQPGILIVDRTVAGEYENYQTPEQSVPAEPLDHPWETCLTMGDSWSYVPHDRYKSTNDLIHLLVKIVSRGGNFLLNIGPSPDGDWDEVAYSRLREIGAWMQVNGQAIYGSRPLTPYQQGNTIFTQSKNGDTKYLFLLSDDSTNAVKTPSRFDLPDGWFNPGKEVYLLGKREPLPVVKQDEKFRVLLPQTDAAYAMVLKITNRPEKKSAGK
jgi:alpha-L-fucosidase